jgi:hypothetical protein
MLGDSEDFKILIVSRISRLGGIAKRKPLRQPNLFPRAVAFGTELIKKRQV